MLFLVLSVFFAHSLPVSAAPTPFVCPGDIHLTPSTPYNVPLTPVAGGQQCSVKFIVPSGYFAIANVTVTGITIAWKGSEEVVIEDSFNTFIGNDGDTKFSSNIAWPTNFDIFINSRNPTQMMIEISVSIAKATPNNIVSRQQTGLNLPSGLVYLSEMKAGTSVAITGESGSLRLFGTYPDYRDKNEANNIFVYDNGVLVGTMYKALRDKDYTSSNNLVLYFAKEFSNPKGAILVVDSAIVNNLSQYFVEYVPLYENQQTQTISLTADWTAAAFTVIGEHDGSTPIDVRGIYSVNGLGNLTFLPSGPVKDFSNGTLLTPNKLPKHLPGFINTFFFSQGQTAVKYTISQ